MTRRNALLAAAAALAIAGTVGALLAADPHARESRRVHRRVAQLAQELTFPEGEPALRKLSYAERVSAFFAEAVDLSLSLGPRSREGTMTHAELEEGCRGMRATLRGLEVSFFDIQPTVDPDLRKATVHLTAKIYFKGDPDYFVQEFRLHLQRPEQVWRISKIETVRTMRR